MTEHVDRKDFEYLRSMLQAAAPSLSAAVAGVAIDRGDPERLRELADAGSRDLLSVAYGALPTGVSFEVADAFDQLVRSTGCPTPEEEELRPVIIHEGFGLAGRYVTDQAFRSGSATSALRQWMDVFRSYEHEVLQEATAAARRETQRCLHRVRHAYAQLLTDLVPDDARARGISDRLRSRVTSSDASTSCAVIPTWLTEKSDVELVPIIVRGDKLPSNLEHVHAAAGSPSICDLTTTLVVEDSPLHVLIAPASDGRDIVDSYAAQPSSGVVVAGIPVSRAQLGESLRWVWRALDLYDGEYLSPTADRESMTVVDCADIRAELVVLADEPLVLSIAGEILTPLRELSSVKKRALAVTLASWAKQPSGGIPAIARDLAVHPQTVRYRLKILRSIYGGKLDDPRQMFLFDIALRYTTTNFLSDDAG